MAQAQVGQQAAAPGKIQGRTDNQDNHGQAPDQIDGILPELTEKSHGVMIIILGGRRPGRKPGNNSLYLFTLYFYWFISFHTTHINPNIKEWCMET